MTHMLYIGLCQVVLPGGLEWIVVAILGCFFPLAIIGGLAYLIYLVSRNQPTDRETRCRRCGHVLRDLTEPRCPDCGEKI